MAADLYLHALTDEINERDIRILMGSAVNDRWMEAYDKISDGPHIHIGENSVLKAALFDDPSYVPSLCSRMFEIVHNGVTVIDDEFINQVNSHQRHPDVHGYDETPIADVVAFLEQQRGKRVFLINL